MMIVIIIGLVAAICGIMVFLKAGKNHRTCTNLMNGDDGKSEHVLVKSSPSVEEVQPKDFDAVKSDAVEKIKDRHEEAQKIIRDSVDNIFQNNEQRETKNEQAKNKMLDDLNNL